ncbi:hypothetical protein [Azospirillum sp.]|uniref:hypothetical protein n=1 Tax=Azospirillum sp. TaxID=34012 RepID=UPI002D6A1342|nr:hypothetical protein [Azospirillum sp.]HYD69396.1 hypothetical protein [Azospirillum sp.]
MIRRVQHRAIHQRAAHHRAIGLAMGVLAVALALSLGGCGKKPEFVDAPQGKEADRFPQAYPNPSLDPRPGQVAPGVAFP